MGVKIRVLNNHRQLGKEFRNTLYPTKYSSKLVLLFGNSISLSKDIQEKTSTKEGLISKREALIAKR